LGTQRSFAGGMFQRFCGEPTRGEGANTRARHPSIKIIASNYKRQSESIRIHRGSRGQIQKKPYSSPQSGRIERPRRAECDANRNGIESRGGSFVYSSKYAATQVTTFTPGWQR